jgi:hypothetical protein
MYNIEEEEDHHLDEQMYRKDIHDKTFGITAKDAVFKKQNREHFILEQFATSNNRVIDNKKLYVSKAKSNPMNN